MADAILPVTGDCTIPEPLQRQLDKAREQGRREVYAEIAKCDEYAFVWTNTSGDSECHFCKTWQEDGHKPDCLWLRARQAVESAQANHEQP